MSFQFPADPKNGDIIVQPQPDGGFIKGTYNAFTNTWEVGELPEEPGVPGPQGPRGPAGPKGDPGKGLQISGVVNTYDELPVAAERPLQFWIVDETNNVYFSDGNEWIDLGGPIRGPQGEGLTSVTAIDTPASYKIQFEGTTDELDLVTPNLRGANGAPGKGWHSTTLIDQRPTNYQIRFNSDDGLEFVTDNILGPKGETGSLEVATATNLGGIKIGRGLNIKPDGTVNAGETAVDLETVPLSPEGTVYSYYIGLKPIVLDWGSQYDTSYVLQDVGTDPEYGGAGPQVPWIITPRKAIGYDQLGDANAAIVFFQARNQFRKAPGNNPGSLKYYRSYCAHSLRMTGATFTNTGSTIMGFPVTHNVTIPGNMSYNDRRSSNAAFSKNQIIRFTPGATIEFWHQVDLLAATQSITDAGSCRVVVIPFKVEGDIEGLQYGLNSPDTFFARSDDEWKDVLDEWFPPQTPEEAVAEQSQQLKDIMRVNLEIINDNLDYVTESEKTQLLEYRDQIVAVKNLPGDFLELQQYLLDIETQVLAIVGFKFRFEPS